MLFECNASRCFFENVWLINIHVGLLHKYMFVLACLAYRHPCWTATYVSDSNIAEGVRGWPVGDLRRVRCSGEKLVNPSQGNCHYCRRMDLKHG